MKTRKLILFLLVNTFLSVNAQEPASFLKDENIKGSVKSMTSIYTGVKHKNEQRKNEYLFNAKGQLVKDTYYWQDKPSSSVTDYTYDARGFLVSEKQTDPVKGTVERKEIYVNDLKGLPMKQTTYYEGSDKPAYIKTYTRNPAGKILTEKSVMMPENKTYYPKFTYKYDLKGNIIEKHTEFGYGVFSHSKYTLTYNQKGKVEKEYEYNEATSMISDGNEYKTMTRKYKYDEKDRVLTVETDEGDIIEHYVYDDFGNMTKEKDAEYIYEQNGLVNSTMKVIRGKVEERYGRRIAALYESNGKDILNQDNIDALS